MVSLRHAQIREYFFGHGEDALAPSSMTADYGDLNIFRVVEGAYFSCLEARCWRDVDKGG